MKKIYFSESMKKNNARRGLIKLSTSLITTLSPALSNGLSYRLFMNPYGKRETPFQSVIPNESFSLKTKRMGEVQVYFFKGGSKHVLLSHGWADTSLCYKKMLIDLLNEGYSVWCFDHIGHGLSDGRVSHMFAFIDGIESVVEEIEKRGHDLVSLVGHSMGGAALLNLDSTLLANKKVVLISIPILFFEDMFKKMDRVGVSKKMVLTLLEDVSKNYESHWQKLKPLNHRDKVSDHFLFIHDRDDRFCPSADVEEFLFSSEREKEGGDKDIQFFQTRGLGHRRLLKDSAVIGKVLEFINHG